MRRQPATTASCRPVEQPGERADDQEQDPVASGGDGVLHFTAAPGPRATYAAHEGYDPDMRPRARDVIGAVILAIVLVALIAYVVSLGAQGT